MDVYKVGKDELCEGAINSIGEDTYKWFVYDYEIGDYCGNGSAIALGKDGNLYTWNLGHCSCCGPIDCPNDYKKWTVEDYFKPPRTVFDNDLIENKARELLHKVKELLNKGV